jgi:VWFA-related protein
MLLASFLLFAQTAFQEKLTVSYVEVPVTVTREGAPVRGLTKENFEILDGGEKRAIESFEAIDFAGEESGAAVSPLNPESRRRFLVVFDLTFATPQSLQRAQQAARTFIARGVGDRDLVAIGTVDVNRGFRFLTAFTTDRELLVGAIADPQAFRTRDPLQIAGANPFAEMTPANATGAPDVADRITDVAADLARGAARADDDYRRARVKQQVELLGSVARSIRNIAGRKHLVLLSEGFDSRLVSGRTASEAREQSEENRAIEFGEVWKVDSEKRYGSTSSMNALTTMAEEFRRADVVLHAVDIQGVRVQNNVREGARLNLNEGLFLLANATGGAVFRNSNDIRSDFDRLMRQQEVVYVLGFRAPAGRTGKFHELRVRLVDVPNARAQHRGGYYDAGGESAIERSLSLAEVIVNDLPQDAIRISALVAPFPTGESRAQVPVMLEIGGAELIANAKNNVATTDIFVYAFDADGTVRDAIYQRVTVDVNKASARLRDRGIRFYGTLRLTSGRYAVKTLVRVAESDAKGYRRMNVEVPRNGDVHITPFFFATDESEWVMVKADANETAPYPFVLDGESFIPAVKATLKRGEPRLFAVFVYNADEDEIAWEFVPRATLVSSKGGKYVFALESPPADARELVITMRRKGSSEARTVKVPIEVAGNH